MNNLLDESSVFHSAKSDTTETQVSREPESRSEARSGEGQTLRECVSTSLKEYFNRVEPQDVSNLYELVLSEVEAPLLKSVMEHTRSNQSKASIMLGLNRGTLRKKLKQYGMLD